ncbi:MAG: segregation/condensation protein A [Polyangiaceae bacterium]|nr:segregation/condensation protein A [Polyangiaceae bacterium]
MAQEPTESTSKRAMAADASGTSEPGASYRVQLPEFEGPLDLLLHLIQQHELDILNIPISFITEKYLQYVMLLDELNIDLASEYLLMAATLTHIKSRSLLPAAPEEPDETNEEEVDPRAELIRRLLEYQKYKHAAEALDAREWLGRDIFLRGATAPSVDGPAPLAPISLFKLLDAFQGVLSRAKTTVDHQIDFERFSITDRIGQLSELLKVRHQLRFEELFEGQISRADLIVTFLALLEMTRLRMTRVYQDGPYAPILIELAVQEDSVEAPRAPSLGTTAVPAEEVEQIAEDATLGAPHGSEQGTESE